MENFEQSDMNESDPTIGSAENFTEGDETRESKVGAGKNPESVGEMFDLFGEAIAGLNARMDPELLALVNG